MIHQPILLSICIPTYNRAHDLEYLLCNILDQINTDQLNGIELCISDNASQDTTAEIVAKYKDCYPNINYYKQETNVGFDRNLLNILYKANGEYCWLFGDDDRFEVGALQQMLNHLIKYPDISGISVNSQPYKPNFAAKARSIIKLPNMSQEKLLTSSSEIISIIGAYMGFISGQIINRKQMLDVLNTNDITNYYNKYLASAFIHLFIFNLMIKQNPQWLYISQPLVGNQCLDPIITEDNFSNRINGIRIYYDFAKAAQLLPDLSRSAYNKLLNDVISSNVYTQIKQLKLLSSQDISFLFVELKQIFGQCRFFWLKVVPMLYCPRFILINLKNGYKRFKGKYGEVVRD